MRWWTAHGASGVATLALGAYLTARALSGVPCACAVAFRAYLAAAATNAATGAALARGDAAPWFRACAGLQMCFLWTAHRLDAGRPLADAGVTLATVALLVHVARRAAALLRGAMRASVLVGVAALALPTAYPAQLALRGQAWWDECVLRRFPYQTEALRHYVYVPLTAALAWMLFAATLQRRGRLRTSLATAFGASVASAIVATVVAQEVHAPEPRSTQKLVVLCAPSTLETRLDFVTPLARRGAAWWSTTA